MNGRLAVQAGRILALAPCGDGVSVRWRPRGVRQAFEGRFDIAINCTGPSAVLAEGASPLLRRLSDERRIRPDHHGLGLDCDRQGRLIDAWGNAWPALYAVGPMTRGASWEITAVPDIRIQARDVAASIAAGLAA